jgi:hypothetical protein
VSIEQVVEVFGLWDVLIIGNLGFIAGKEEKWCEWCALDG